MPNNPSVEIRLNPTKYSDFLCGLEESKQKQSRSSRINKSKTDLLILFLI